MRRKSVLKSEQGEKKQRAKTEQVGGKRRNLRRV